MQHLAGKRPEIGCGLWCRLRGVGGAASKLGRRGLAGRGAGAGTRDGFQKG